MLKNVSDDPTPCCLLQQTTDSYAALILPPLPRGHVIVLTVRPSSDGLLIRSPRRFFYYLIFHPFSIEAFQEQAYFTTKHGARVS